MDFVNIEQNPLLHNKKKKRYKNIQGLERLKKQNNKKKKTLLFLF